MFGVIPAYGFYVRHVNGIAFDNVNVSYEKDDARPAFVLDDVKNAEFFRSNVELAGKEKMFSLKNVTGFRLIQSRNLVDTTIAKTDRKEL